MARRLPTLSGLEALEAYGRHGVMARAADELGITHGAVSRRLGALEAATGAALLEGPRNRPRLTPAGRVLADALSHAFSAVAAALPGAETKNALTLSCSATLAQRWLIPRLDGFLRDWPDLNLKIVETTGPVRFGVGGVDAAILMEGDAVPPGARSRPFMDQHHGPVIQGALFARCDGDLSRVLALPRLACTTYPMAWALWSARAGAPAPDGAVVQTFAHNAAMLEAAAAGLGVAVAPWAFVAREVDAGVLAAPFGFVALKTRFVHVRPRLGGGPVVEALCAWLQAEGRRGPPPPGPPARTRP